MSAARPLVADDLVTAAVVLAEGLPEIPEYAAVLGAHAADPVVCDSLARVFLRPLINAGCVVGVDDDGRLVGLLVMHRPSVGALDSDTSSTAADLDFLLSHPDLATRLLARVNEPALPTPEPDAVTISIAAVAKTHRSSGVLRSLVRVVEEACMADGVRFCTWTAREDLRDIYCAAWSLTPFAERRLDGEAPLYGLASARPPVLSSSRTHS
ncbi:hypothetical protein JVX90_15950 [Gordonia sp. PDNC005]|uniref:hypothetical protein n=1 Tax=unclassified Gordonia (in: high G+C Gram-positive bacteria) TaxID=2657482 RepID=UPI001964DEBB|nr:hypothetical protein [Gordonia sp. PDNC005]QRY61882.1 hypothetical protein JVX90_15950 [Gordonia sp. PDNC005]